MKLELAFSAWLCYTPVFVINGVKADSGDFGEQFDKDLENAEDYGCGDMTFSPIPATSEILAKYNISLAEYALIASQLENGLSFGACGLCV